MDPLMMGIHYQSKEIALTDLQGSFFSSMNESSDDSRVS